MSTKTEFSKFMTCIKPLKEKGENVVMFTNRILEIYTPYTYECDDYIEISRSDSAIKKYFYGSVDISRDFAINLLQYKDEVNLRDFFSDVDDSISELMLDNTIKLFNVNGVTLHNLATVLAEKFTEILIVASQKDNVSAKVPITPENFVGKIFIKGNVLHIEDAKLSLPMSRFQEEISLNETKLKYLQALIDAYNDAEKTNYNLSDVSSLKKRYKKNLREQRINYFEADCLQRFTRDNIKSSEDEFQNLLNETYDGIINTCRRSFPNGYERLLSVLEQAIKIDLSASCLYHIPKLLNNKKKLGFCHMLVNDARIQWVEEE